MTIIKGYFFYLFTNYTYIFKEISLAIKDLLFSGCGLGNQIYTNFFLFITLEDGPVFLSHQGYTILF
jgi:hypothetical protein